MKKFISSMMPEFLRRAVRNRNAMKELKNIRIFTCDTKSLISKSSLILEEIFNSSQIGMEWDEHEKKTVIFQPPGGTGGVNPGDRRAVYYLVSKFKPSSVLEIGTHIGASTLHIAAALYKNQNLEGAKKQPCLVSVDITNVNDPVAKPWLKY